jgi:SAM-dependent methyltransferase
MIAQVAGVNLLHELVCCPRCRGPLRIGGTACAACGAACGQEGSIINFLDAGAFMMPSQRDVPLVPWLVENRRRFDAARGGPGPTDFGPLADGVVTAQEIHRLASGTTLQQILNDLKRILDGTAAPSPTVEFMLEQTTIGPDSMVLDVGCSAGRHLWEIAPRSPRLMAGADIQFFPLAVGARAWQAAQAPCQPSWCAANILSLPFKDGAFTHVHCFVTLSVVPIRAAMAELVRVLAPGGQLIVTVEGMGYWQRAWDQSSFFSRERIHLLRRWLGERLLRLGANWQQAPLLRKLAGHMQYTRPTLERIMNRAGLDIEAFRVLTEYNHLPLLFGLRLRKRAA